MEKLYWIICIIEIIIQIIYIIKLKKTNTNDHKYWNRFMGITMANFISPFLAGYILINTSLGLEVIFYLFFLFLLFLGNLILLIIGLLNKGATLRLNKSSFYTFFCVILLVILILLIIPSVNNYINKNTILKNSINYLNNKYGDENFQIVEIKKDYAYEGLNKIESGYELTVSSPLLKDNFTMYADNEHFSKIKNVTEFFVETYYNEKMNDYLSKEYNIELDIRIREEKIPETVGHIPTIDELSNSNSIDSIHIRIRNDNYDKNINKRIDYIKQISKDLIDKFKISREINIIFRKYGFSDSYSYEVQMSENIIKIIDEHNKTSIYEYNINDIENKN